ncbi:MAG: Zn-dependent hydrolase [Gammaproteobacteria bacterium]|nr:Zn-dependent hydrolase [Gammaproteobacteria bacterium]
MPEVNTISELRINGGRLCRRIEALAATGAIEGDGVCRLALTDEDRKGRDLVCGWMKQLGMRVSVDRIGNVVGVRGGLEDVAPVMTGSHIDSVATGGRYDGALGVLAGLEVIASLNDAGVNTRRPLAVAFFTNEEGVRFAPDMMGSGVHQGALDLEEMLASRSIDGKILGEELKRIGYAGATGVNRFRAHCFIELHVEQGPVLEREAIGVAAVTGVQGISWTEYRIDGTANHAGTTPMHLRQDAGYVAAAIAVEARRIAIEMGGSQVATVGAVELVPNLVNVIAGQALMTVDLRNMEEALLQGAEQRLADFVNQIGAREGVEISQRKLARFEPVAFDDAMVALVEEIATSLGFSCRRMPSGAGHDAQMFAPNCPTAMIFVPSKDGISHNVAEYTAPQELEAGANVLLQVVLNKSDY